MNYAQNTGFSNRSSNLSKREEQNFKNSPESSSMQRQVLPAHQQEGAVYQNTAYRSQKFPDQLNFDQLVGTKQVLQELLRQFGDKNSRVVFEPYKKEEYSKRLMLLEQQIQGLMRQSYLYATRNPGQRALDYSSLITEKENQVNQLQRKISYLESQLRMKDQREQELEKQLQRRFESIRNKNNEIELLKGSQKTYAQNNKYPNEVVNNMARKLMSSLDNLLKRGNASPSQLENQIQSWILGLPGESMLKHKLRSADESWLEDKYKRYVSYLTTEAASVVNNIQKLYTSQIVNLKSSGAPVDYDPKILQLFGQDGVSQQFFPSEEVISRTQINNEISNQSLIAQSWFRSKNLNNVSKVSVQVPVQDIRTKALITKLAKQMKKLYTKYPKLASQISPELSEYLSQQILDVIEVDQLDRLVQIVKYKPDVIKVQNVYNFNTEKNRRAEFHLKVLIKALLEEMERMKLKTGIQPEIDQGVIGMIRQEIVDVVDVDDILKVYRVVPKIVEVEKVVEQVVEKIVPVPHYVTVQLNKTEVVPVSTVQVVKDTVNVPLQISTPHPLIQEKLIVGNQYHEKVVLKPTIEQNSYETVREVPTLRQVEQIVEVPREVAVPVEIPGPERIVPMQKTLIQKLIEEKIVPVEKIVERVVEVEKIVQKIVEVVKEVPKIVVVEKVVEKLVPQIKYLESKRVENLVVEKPVEVICQVEKVIPIEKIVQRVVSYPEIVQKLVPVNTISQVIKQVQIIKEVPVYMKQLVVQDRIVEKPLPPIVQQVIKPVDQIIQIPVIHEKVRVETEYRKQPIIEREEKLIREPVHLQVPVILTEQKYVQVEKPLIQYIKQQYPKQIIKQKIVPIETVRDQLIPTPFIVEKVIQKMVQVPRIVEIEKIVEKIVPVPRIVEKIVEVQKIIEKIVERNVYHTNIQPVQYLKEVPIEVESVVTLEVPQYIYQTKEVPKIIEVPVPVVSEVRTQTVRVEQVQQPPRVAIQRRQIPMEIIREKLAPMIVQDHVYVELKQQLVVPIEIPVPQTLIEQKLVPVEYVIPLIQPVDKIRQKIVEVKVQTPGDLIVEDRIIEKLFIQSDVKVVRDEIPYYNQQIKQVEVIVDKIVPVERIIQQIREVPHIVEKIVNQVNEIPKVYEVQRIVQVPIKEQELITVDRIVPKMVTLHKAFAQIADKLHEFPRLAEEMKQVQRRIDNIAVERHDNTDIINSEVMVEKAVIQQKLKQVDKYINVINQSLNVVDRIVEKPTDPIIIYEQKILQVPVIVQKLAERIVVMPQVVEVLKYIHDVTETDNLGMAVSADIGQEEAEYQRLGKNVNRQLANLRNSLSNMRGAPQYQDQIATVDRFLAQFNKFLAYPRLREIITEKVVQNTVQKDKIVRVPTKSSEDEKRNLASAVLIDKLLNELKRVKLSNPNVQMNLDPQIAQIFGTQLEPISSKYGNNYNQLLDEYNRAIFAKFNTYGTFTPGHQLMLKEYIEERFDLAAKMKKLSKDAAKYKELNSGLVEKYNREHQYNQVIRRRFGEISDSLTGIIIGIMDLGLRSSMEMKLKQLGEVIFGYASGADTPVYKLGELDDERSSRYLREKDTQILEYRRVIETLKKQLQKQRVEQKAKLVYADCPVHTKTIRELQSQILELRRQISNHRCTTITSKTEDHTKCNLQIKRLNQELIRIRNQLNKYKEEINILNIQIVRLRIVEKAHMECEGIILGWKRKLNDCQREKNSQRKTTQTGDYGRNFMEYVQLDNSRHSSDHSLRSDNSRGVYRSAGNYAGGISESNKAISMEQLPQNNSLVASRQSGGIRTDLNSNQIESPRNIRTIQSKDLAFSKKSSSSKSGLSEGGSSGLYGISNREFSRRTQEKQ